MTLSEIGDCIETAYDWHGGMSSPLYSFASTRRVHGACHRGLILREIRDCMRGTNSTPEHGRLEMLHKLISEVALNHEICTNEDMTRHWA